MLQAQTALEGRLEEVQAFRARESVQCLSIYLRPLTRMPACLLADSPYGGKRMEMLGDEGKLQMYRSKWTSAAVHAGWDLSVTVTGHCQERVSEEVAFACEI